MTTIEVPAIADLTQICRSFPDSVAPEVMRDQVIKSIDDHFDSGGVVAVLKGGSGYGKTVLMSQVARHHRHTSISLFVSGANKWTYSFEVCLFDLYNQIHWLLEGVEARQEAHVDEPSFTRILLKLRNTARRDGRPYYFLLDGLDQVPDEAMNTRDRLLELMGWEHKQFRFVLSSAPDRVETVTSAVKKEGVQVFPVYGFSMEETKTVLDGLGLADTQVAELARACRYVPRFLGRARRLLTSSVSEPDMVLDIVRKFRKGFIEMDWQSLSGDEALRKVVGHIVFDRRSRTVDQLAYIAALQPDDLRNKLSKLPFLRVDSTTNVVRLDNVEEKKALVEFLAPYETDIRSSIASSMLASSVDDPEDAYYLPDALRDAGRYAELLERLSPDNLGPLIESSHSLVPIQRMTQAGLDAADKLESVNGILQLSLCIAGIRQALQSDATRDHVAAHAALGNWEQAIAIAEGSRTKEEKLHGLSVILAAQKDCSAHADESLLDRIRTLSAEIDATALGPVSAEIAGNIIDSLPDVAASILRDIERTGSRPQEADWRLASVAIRRGIDREESKPAHQAIIDKVTNHVSDTEARSYLLGLKALTSTKTADQILSELEAVEDVESCVVLGANWLRTHYRQSGAVRVADSLLDTVIAATGVTPDAQLYQDLAMPLPYANLGEAEPFLGKLATQALTVAKRGPTEAYVQLLALICHGYLVAGSTLGVARLDELVAYIQSLPDAATRAACWASLFQASSRMQRNEPTGRAKAVAAQANAEMHATVNIILAQSADHLASLKNCLRVLAAHDADSAIQIATRINTQARRDEALKVIITVFKEKLIGKEEVPWHQVWQALDLIADGGIQADSLLGVLTVLPILQIEIPLDCLRKIAARVSRVVDPILRARCCVKLLAYRYWVPPPDGPLRHRQELLDAVKAVLPILTDEWERLRAVLSIAAEIRPSSIAESDQMLALAQDIRSQSSTANEQAADAYASVVSLLGRALLGLAQTGSVEEKDIDRVRLIINRVADPLRRFDIWARIALRLGDEVIPKRSTIICEMSAIWAHLSTDQRKHLIEAIPEALYLMNPADTLDRLSCLDKASRDRSLSLIFEWHIKRVPSGEPYEHLHGDQYRLTFDDWTRVSPLLQRLETDQCISTAISSIGDAFRYQRNLTTQQSEEIGRSLIALIRKRLPDPDNIRHEGYAIVSEAEVLRIRQASGKEWESLKDRAVALDNSADSAYVLSLLAGARGGTKSAWALACIAQAREKLANIPTIADRVDRCCTAIEIAREINKDLATSLVRQAWEDMGLLGAPDTRSLAKTIIDEAYRIDPRLASTLVAGLDDDPVRLRYRKALRARLRVLKDADSDDLLARSKNLDDESIAPLVQAVQIRIARLHADKEKPAALPETNHLVLRGASQSLDDVYWLFAYHIENSARRYRSKPAEYRKHLRDLFEGVAGAAEIVWRVASRPVSVVALSNIAPPSGGMHVNGDSPESVRAFIEAWLLRHTGDHLLLCDPYFDKEDLECIKWISSLQATVTRITVLGGFPKYTEGASKSAREIIRDYWRDHVERNSEPPLEVCHTWTAVSRRCPFHYRAIVVGDAGLDIGTSLKSLGLGRSDTLKEMSPFVAKEIWREAEGLLKHTRREFEGERLQREFIGF